MGKSHHGRPGSAPIPVRNLLARWPTTVLDTGEQQFQEVSMYISPHNTVRSGEKIIPFSYNQRLALGATGSFNFPPSSGASQISGGR